MAKRLGPEGGLSTKETTEASSCPNWDVPPLYSQSLNRDFNRGGYYNP